MDHGRYGRVKIWSLAVATVFGVAIGLTTGIKAHAVTCLSNLYNTTDQASADGRGNRVNSPGMTVYNNNVDCSRVSSLFVKNGTETKFVEIGWFEDPSDNNFDYQCLGNTSGPPKIFTFVENAGMVSCFTGAELSAGSSEELAESDQNQNGVWRFFRSGNQIDTSPDMGAFNSGLLRTNGERGGSGDPASADFAGLDRMDDTSSWVAWQNPFEAATSDDPDYKDCIDNGHHIRVIPNGTC